MDIKTKLQVLGLRKLYDYIDKNPNENIFKAVSTAEKFVPAGALHGQISEIKKSPIY